VNTELLIDAHAVARANSAAVQAVVAAAAASAAVIAAEHQHLTVSPRRFIAGTFMLAGLGVTRQAARLLPRDSPMRVFVTGMVDGVPVHWCDLASFARRRATPSAADPSP
jgi:uncharacterized circularly permuted ATP-grasp superfamily protein